MYQVSVSIKQIPRKTAPNCPQLAKYYDHGCLERLCVSQLLRHDIHATKIFLIPESLSLIFSPPQFIFKYFDKIKNRVLITLKSIILFGLNFWQHMFPWPQFASFPEYYMTWPTNPIKLWSIKYFLTYCNNINCTVKVYILYLTLSRRRAPTI